MITNGYNYYLTRDKVRRKILPYQRNDYAGLACYALNMANGCKIRKHGTLRRHYKTCRLKDG